MMGTGNMSVNAFLIIFYELMKKHTAGLLNGIAVSTKTLRDI